MKRVAIWAVVCGVAAGGISAGASTLTRDQWNTLHEAFHDAVEQLWGPQEEWRNHPTILVHYSADLFSRSLVDFAAGTVRVEQLSRETQPLTAEGTRDALECEVLQLLRYCNTCPMRIAKGRLDPAFTAAPAPTDQLLPDPGSNSHLYRLRPGDTLASIATRFGVTVDQLKDANKEQLEPLTWHVDMPLRIPEPTHSVASPQPQSLLEGQLRHLAGEVVTPDTVESFAAQVVREGKFYDRVTTGSDGVMRDLMGTVFKLAEDHMAVRSQTYLPTVRDVCERYRVPVARAMAVMHVESAFNPRAVSRSDAYGLMQIVPQTAGREAYQFIYGSDRAPSPRQLLDPRVNILLGVGYLHLLDSRYFADLTDPDARRACVIAAYNAGPSHVREILGRLAPEALQDADQITRHLRAQLPSSESRDYLPAVLGLLPRYSVLEQTRIAQRNRPPSAKEAATTHTEETHTAQGESHRPRRET